jgi:hypothetical protein
MDRATPPFQDWPNEQVLKRVAGVYTVWDGERLLYVGMSGRAMVGEDLEVGAGDRGMVKKVAWGLLDDCCRWPSSSGGGRRDVGPVPP